jgi:tousled-like kinase
MEFASNTHVFFFSSTHFLLSGKDLDVVLKATPVLLEREARIIIVQIFQGHVYLNKRAQKIIHYDLKPVKVFFDGFGIVKVTDFGISKIVEEDVGSQGMELTSQGAGTYWQVTLKFVICDFGCCKCLIFCFKK